MYRRALEAKRQDKTQGGIYVLSNPAPSGGGTPSVLIPGERVEDPLPVPAPAPVPVSVLVVVAIFNNTDRTNSKISKDQFPDFKFHLPDQLLHT